MPEYAWYEVVEAGSPLAQGDFIDDCPIMIPTGGVTDGRPDVEVRRFDVVVMSQSCDLQFGKVDWCWSAQCGHTRNSRRRTTS